MDWQIKKGIWLMEFWFKDPNKTEITFNRGDKVVSATPGYYRFETSDWALVFKDYINMEEVKECKITYKND